MLHSTEILQHTAFSVFAKGEISALYFHMTFWTVCLTLGLGQVWCKVYLSRCHIRKLLTKAQCRRKLEWNSSDLEISMRFSSSQNSDFYFELQNNLLQGSWINGAGLCSLFISKVVFFTLSNFRDFFQCLKTFCIKSGGLLMMMKKEQCITLEQYMWLFSFCHRDGWQIEICQPPVHLSFLKIKTFYAYTVELIEAQQIYIYLYWSSRAKCPRISSFQRIIFIKLISAGTQGLTTCGKYLVKLLKLAERKSSELDLWGPLKSIDSFPGQQAIQENVSTPDVLYSESRNFRFGYRLYSCFKQFTKV